MKNTKTYTREEINTLLRGLTDMLITNLALTQYPKENYKKVTEDYIRSIK